MKTQWTHPQKGATLVELFLLFVDSEFDRATSAILKLKEKYGSDTRTGLGIKNDNYLHLEDIDSERATSPILAEYVQENFEYDKKEAEKEVICVRCKNKKEVKNERR